MNERQQAAKEEQHALISKMQAPGYYVTREEKAQDLATLDELNGVLNPPEKPNTGPRASAGLPAPIQRTAPSVSREPAPAMTPGHIPGYWLSRFLGDSPWMATYGNAALGWRTRGR